MRNMILAMILILPALAKGQDKNRPDAMAGKTDTAVITQLDGSKLHVICGGTIYESYCETIDGYTLMLNNTGIYEYAKRAGGGDLKGNGVVAKDEEERTAGEKRSIAGLKKHLRYKGKKLKRIEAQEKKVKDDPAIIKRYRRN